MTSHAHTPTKQEIFQDFVFNWKMINSRRLYLDFIIFIFSRISFNIFLWSLTRAFVIVIDGLKKWIESTRERRIEWVKKTNLHRCHTMELKIDSLLINRSDLFDSWIRCDLEYSLFTFFPLDVYFFVVVKLWKSTSLNLQALNHLVSFNFKVTAHSKKKRQSQERIARECP